MLIKSSSEASGWAIMMTCLTTPVDFLINSVLRSRPLILVAWSMSSNHCSHWVRSPSKTGIEVNKASCSFSLLDLVSSWYTSIWDFCWAAKISRERDCVSASRIIEWLSKSEPVDSAGEGVKWYGEYDSAFRWIVFVLVAHCTYNPCKENYYYYLFCPVWGVVAVAGVVWLSQVSVVCRHLWTWYLAFVCWRYMLRLIFIVRLWSTHWMLDWVRDLPLCCLEDGLCNPLTYALCYRNKCK